MDKLWEASLDRNKGGYKNNKLNKLIAKKVKESMKKSLKKMRCPTQLLSRTLVPDGHPCFVT